MLKLSRQICQEIHFILLIVGSSKIFFFIFLFPSPHTRITRSKKYFSHFCCDLQKRENLILTVTKEKKICEIFMLADRRVTHSLFTLDSNLIFHQRNLFTRQLILSSSQMRQQIIDLIFSLTTSVHTFPTFSQFSLFSSFSFWNHYRQDFSSSISSGSFRFCFHEST